MTSRRSNVVAPVLVLMTQSKRNNSIRVIQLYDFFGRVFPIAVHVYVTTASPQSVLQMVKLTKMVALSFAQILIKEKDVVNKKRYVPRTLENHVPRILLFKKSDVKLKDNLALYVIIFLKKISILS